MKMFQPLTRVQQARSSIQRPRNLKPDFRSSQCTTLHSPKTYNSNSLFTILLYKCMVLKLVGLVLFIWIFFSVLQGPWTAQGFSVHLDPPKPSSLGLKRSMSYGGYIGGPIGLLKGDIRSSDYNSHTYRHS